MYNPTKPYKKPILDLIKQTWNTPHVVVENGIVKKKFNYLEYYHVDGVGTKGIYHWEKRTFKNAVLDALAMNLNDLAVVGAVPYALTNHLMLPKNDQTATVQIIKELVGECKKRKIAITGGETAIHNNMEGLEISITMLGFIKPSALQASLIKKTRVNKFTPGDVIIGIASGGLHSNGFTKVREVFSKTYKPAFIKPTLIYLDCFLRLGLYEMQEIHGMHHITGWSLAKLKDNLQNTDLFIHRNHKLKPQKIFKEIYQKGTPDKEMYSTANLNCGIGFILSVAPEFATKLLTQLNTEFKADIIGKVRRGTGKVKIESMFSKKLVEF